MIFVTVGTHEQPFNRLVKAVNDLKMSGKITDSVFIQTGYSTYVPKACEYKDFISMNQMNEYMEKANIIITHGGPSSFIMALQHNKVPIVVPRLSKFNEHVNNHQLIFCNELFARGFSIKVVENIDDLASYINLVSTGDYNDLAFMNNKEFMQRFKKAVFSMLGE